MSIQVTCGYCREDAELVDKSEVHGKGFAGKVWLCRPCKAWVPAHPDSPEHKPIGTLAKSHLRAKRVHALFEFDRVWRLIAGTYAWSENRARQAAYGWLASEMHIHARGCNIHAFDEVRTQIVIDICSAVAAGKVAA